MGKLGIISLSTACARMTIINYTQGGYFIVEKELCEPLGLVKDMDRDGYLKPNRIEECMDVLRTFRTVLDFYKIENLFCIADSSFMQARNQLAFFDEIYKTLSLLFKVNDEMETMNALHSAMLYSVASPKGVVIDIEDDYICIMKYNRRTITDSTTLPFGARKIADNYLQVVDPEEKMQKMTEFVVNELKRIRWLQNIEPEYEIIGVGEAFEQASRLIRKSTHYPLDETNNFFISNKDFLTIYNLVKGLDLDKAKKLKGISEDRIDVLASGLAFIRACFSEFVPENIRVCTHGQLYGQTIRILFAQAQERPLVDVLGYSLSTIEEFYPTATNIGDVYDVAIMLYKQLKVLHKLPKHYTKVLRIAASMCMSGKRISYANYVKNCFDVILHSEIMGATHKDIVLAAFVCATQDIDDFNATEWVRYKDIVGDEEIESIKKMGLLVRIARDLCCTGMKNVREITCDILGDTVILKTAVEYNAQLEISQAMVSAVNFRKIFKKNLQIL